MIYTCYMSDTVDELHTCTTVLHIQKLLLLEFVVKGKKDANICHMVMDASNRTSWEITGYLTYEMHLFSKFSSVR